MITIPLAAAAGVMVPSSMLIRRICRTCRRKKFMTQPLPVGLRDQISQIALYQRVPENFRSELHGHVQNFLAEKHFEGCGGITLTEEMKLTIAAQACVLLLARKASYFPKCDAILVYPSAYVAESQRSLGVVQIKEQTVRLGESWQQGLVVLAWDRVHQQAMQEEHGHNVVLHEFAHQLDQEDGASDGTPILAERALYKQWREVMTEAFTELTHKAQHGMHDVLDRYGATNPAEFFAVATETFFTNAYELESHRPELYALLKAYYQLDPLTWQRSS